MATNQRARVQMDEAEIRSFLEEGRTATLASIGLDGAIHLVAMWYGVLNGVVYFETKTKSQKAVNLRRDSRISCLVEAGDSYDQLRGVAIEGTATIIEDPDDPEYWPAAINVYERYGGGSYTEEARPAVEKMMHKRFVVRVDAARVRSWDHRKLASY
jgi:PPOX class probable F420-dependent enzyme